MKTFLILMACLSCVACADDDGGSTHTGVGNATGTLAAYQQSEVAVALERCRCDRTFGSYEDDLPAANAQECAQDKVYWVEEGEEEEESKCRDDAAAEDPMFAAMIGCASALNDEVAACYRTNTACTEAAWEACWEGKDDDECFEMYPLSAATQQKMGDCRQGSQSNW